MWGHRTDNWTKLLAVQVKAGKWGNLGPGPYDSKIPRTPSTAQITKESGSSPPQLFQAHANADMFDERDSRNGIRIRLSRAEYFDNHVRRRREWLAFT
jgi:hypothetical protein